MEIIFITISSGTILRVWDINNSGSSNTSGLASYWSHCLLMFNENNHPKLVWGPYTEPSFGSVQNYRVYRNVNSAGWYYSGLTNSSTYQFVDMEFTTGSKSDAAQYYIKAYNGSSYSGETNTMTSLGIYYPNKEQAENKQNITTLSFSLNQNYPNPFNPSTTIKYQLPSDGFVTLKVYDILGREITTLVNEYKQGGSYDVKFNASELSSGIYFYKITANGKSGKYTAINKMQLLK